jgi:anti-sigma B factor antagonist
MLEVKCDVNEKNMIYINGEVDIYTVGKFRKPIKEMIEADVSEIILNCSDLSYMDSTGIGVLIELRKITMDKGQEIVVLNPRPNIKNLLRITGVDKIIKIVESRC